MMIGNYRSVQIYLICSILTLFIFGCAGGSRQIRKGDLCDQIEESWLPDGRRPAWIDKPPGPKSNALFFVGQSNKYSAERDARNKAYQDAVTHFAAYCGVNIQVMDQYMSLSQTSASQTADPDIIEKEEISQEYQAFVSRIKPIEWAMKQFICKSQQKDISSSFMAYVLVSVPEDEINKVQKYQAQKGSQEIEKQQKLEAVAKKKKEAELRSVFEKVTIANQFLAKGLIFTALEALAKADEVFQNIPKGHHYHTLYPVLQQEYKFSCNDLRLQRKQIMESVCLEKVEGDNQTVVTGKTSPAPLVLRAFVFYQEQHVPLKNVSILFQDDKGDILQSIQTNLKGLASYQPSVSRPGNYRFQALLALKDKGDIDIQRKAFFSLTMASALSAKNKKLIDEELSVVVNFLYERNGKVDKMYDGMTLQSEKDYYQIYFRPVQDCYVYIFQVDSHGLVNRLFPNNALAPWNNPVKADKSYYIPFVGQAPIWLYLDRNTGEERIFLLASRQADNEIDHLFAQLAQEGTTNLWKQRLSTQIKATASARGLGGVVGGPKIQHQGRDAHIFEMAGDLMKSADQEFFYSISFNHVD